MSTMAAPSMPMLPRLGPLLAAATSVSVSASAHANPASPTMCTPTGLQAAASERLEAAFATTSPVQQDAKKRARKDAPTFDCSTGNLQMLTQLQLPSPVGAMQQMQLQMQRNRESSTAASMRINAVLASPTSPMSDDASTSPLLEDAEKLRVSRERNRLHAQRTRIRKRELLESLKTRIAVLQDEYRLLRQAYESHVTAMYLLSLGDQQAQLRIQGMDDALAAEQDTAALLHVVAVNEEDVDAVAAMVGAGLHEKSCPCAQNDNDADDENSGMEDASGMCTCACAELLPLNRHSSVAPYPTSPNALHSAYGKDAREQIRRERNRLHARRARLRKKLLLEKSQKAVHDLRVRNDGLRAKLSLLVASIYDGRHPMSLPPTTIEA